MKHFARALFALLLLPAIALADDVAQALVEFAPPQPLSIETQSGSVFFMVELADTDERRTQGLMFRENLADDAGMLFDFEEPRQINMWMKNTLIALDMIFIDEAGQIISIARNARPKSLRRIPSGGLAASVLEIGGGRARALNIARGDLVRHALFGNAVNTAPDPSLHGKTSE